MSTEILDGKDGLHITSFFGGRAKGMMLQITPASGYTYVQFDIDQMRELVAIQLAWLIRYGNGFIEADKASDRAEEIMGEGDNGL